MPPPLNEEQMTESERQEYRAARFLWEYNFYRRLTNFAHHHTRSLVESKPETVMLRKLFDRAERLNLAGETLEALKVYRTPVAIRDSQGNVHKLTPLAGWRDLILMKNKDYRRDSFTQEQAAEIQLRYLMLDNRQDGMTLKKRLARASALLPLVPKYTPEAFRPPIVRGPFDLVDEDGDPIIPDHVFDLTMERMNLPSRRSLLTPQRPMGPPQGKEMGPQPGPGQGPTR
jgi:hypothetical protein